MRAEDVTDTIELALTAKISNEPRGEDSIAELCRREGISQGIAATDLDADKLARRY